jgi:2'-5' RNA ligase
MNNIDIRRRLIVFCSFVLLAQGCCFHASCPPEVVTKSSAMYQVDAGIMNTLTINSPNDIGLKGGYVSMAIPATGIKSLKSQIEASTGLSLHDRGEAHITVVTPPEFAVLRVKLSPQEIFRLLGAEAIQSEKFELVCVGAGKKHQGSVTKENFFVVVTSPGILQRRARLAQAFYAAGGVPAAFSAEHFYPHITIGFTHSDLYEEDGVIKDKRSCIGPITVSP